MSGHSKWSSIKHKKGAVDAKRGKIFTKLSRTIQVAAREGGVDPNGNPTLAQAIQKAKEVSMPKDNIKRAIDKGGGEGSSADQMVRITYEGYVPGGVAVLVDTITDNRNRTGSEIRHLFAKHGGSLGEPGSVAWIFHKEGKLWVDGTEDEEVLLLAIEAGANDVILESDRYEVSADPSDLQSVRVALEDAGVEVIQSDVIMEATQSAPISGAQALQAFHALSALEDHDDVEAVHANLEMDDEMAENLP